MKKSLKKALVSLLILIFVFAVFFATPWGHPAWKTMLLVPEIVPNFPFKPLELISRKPELKEVKFMVSGKETSADLYIPGDNKKHPAIIFTIGNMIGKRDPLIFKVSNALSRMGYVVFIPESPDFLNGYVWTDSVNTFISSVEYLEKQDFVKREKIGIAGFCVGASAAIIAAEDPRIAVKVSFISAISPYFDLKTLSDSVITKTAENEAGNFVPWTPAQLSLEAVQKGFINYVPSEEERKTLTEIFVKGKTVPVNRDQLSTEGRAIYDFLSNSNRSSLDKIWDEFPEQAKMIARDLSPKTKISDLRAKVLILSDKNDTFVPRIEGLRLAKSLKKGQVFLMQVDSFEHVSPNTKLKRWSVVTQLFQVGRYVYNVMLTSGS